MKYAIDLVSPKGRFSRSANVERDARADIIESYIPTGRALDVVSRLARSTQENGGARAFSITGPYGNGKSSLALFVDALFGPPGDPNTKSASGVLEAVDPVTAELLEQGKEIRGKQGFVRCVITAAREPVSVTLVRAIANGIRRYPSFRRSGLWRNLLSRVESAISEVDGKAHSLPTTRFILEILGEISEIAPVIILIDEFGKNLEAFADSKSDSDLYLLQELVEWSHGANRHALPVITVTMQHLSFEDYLDSVSLSLRREWAKVQGRFEDIPYIDTPAQTRHLIGQVNEDPIDKIFLKSRREWATNEYERLREAGLAHEVELRLIERTWPLHPSALLVLPELCSRFGQNERTLFSFLASAEPKAIPAWLTAEQIGRHLNDVRLDRIYDYFVESAATSASTSQTASRWIEVETCIRDASELTIAERRVLKAVGLLNLISAGGSIRASKRVLTWACSDGLPGTSTPSEVVAALKSLENSGRITYREFADEFRLWKGSDLDLRSALESAKRRLRQTSVENLLSHTRSMLPVVAMRHSTETGTLRVFKRVWCSSGQLGDDLDDGNADGIVVYVVGPNFPTIPNNAMVKPIVAVRPLSTEELVRTALELAAIRSVLSDSVTLGDDWVARRELTEREAEALAHFEIAFEASVGNIALGTEWWLLNTERGRARKLSKPSSLTSALSKVCDQFYGKSPRVANEMLNRHELTSQGAKARRLLIEAMITNPTKEYFGIGGFPPERAMYDAIFGSTGIHRRELGHYVLATPSSPDWLDAWSTLSSAFDESKLRRITINEIIDILKSPPIGMKEGSASVLVMIGIVVYRDDVAVYEHGTYRPRITKEIAERLLKNPSHFQIKHFAATRGSRRLVVNGLSKSLAIDSWRGTSPSVLLVVGHLVAFVNGLPPYSLRTKNLSQKTAAVRRALMEATEPDVLIFETLPKALAIKDYDPRRGFSEALISSYSRSLKSSIKELGSLHAKLLEEVVGELVSATASRSIDARSELVERAIRMKDKVIDPKLRALLAALSDREKDDQGWAEYVAMTVVGPATGSWSDDDRLRYLSSIRELSGTLRRIEAIHFDRLALDDAPFDALRLTVTRPDGAEIARVVGLDDRSRDAIEHHLNQALERITLEVGESSNAQELLLAALAHRMLPEIENNMSHPERSFDLGVHRKKRGSQ